MVVSVKNKIIENNNVFHLQKLRSYRKKHLIIAAIGLFLYGCETKSKTPKPTEINVKLTPKKVILNDEILNEKEADIINNGPLFQFETSIDSIRHSTSMKRGVLDYVQNNVGIDVKLEQTDSRFNIRYLGSSQRLGYDFFLLSSLIDIGRTKLNRHSILVYFNDRLEARYIVKNSDYFPRSVSKDELVFEIYDDNYKSKSFKFDFLTSPPPCLNFDNYSSCISKF
jgi:hypothetical protein